LFEERPDGEVDGGIEAVDSGAELDELHAADYSESSGTVRRQKEESACM
jgi:hypothetical protein